LKTETNRMNNDNRAHDANDSGDELCVGLVEMESQAMLQRNHEFEKESSNNCCRSEHHCFWKHSISHKMQLPLKQSGWREANNFLKHELLKLTFFHGSNNNQSNWQKRMQKKAQMQFLCPQSIRILNLLGLANNHKTTESMCMQECDRQCHLTMDADEMGLT